MVEVRLRGKPASPGVGVAPSILIVHRLPGEAVVEDPLKAFREAVAEEGKWIGGVVERLWAEGREDEALILEAQLLILDDPNFTGLVEKLIGEGLSLADAVKKTVNEVAELFGKTAYMKARRSDLMDLANRIIARVHGATVPDLKNISRMVVVVADELYPSETAEMRKELVAGIATERGGVTAHAAIIARNYGIPAVVGVESLLEHVKGGELVVVDGVDGTIIVNPKPETVEKALSKGRRIRELYEKFSKVEAYAADGIRVHVEANIGSPDELELAVFFKSDGVGLLRTEFLFIGRDSPPSEEEQYSIYRELASRISPKPLIIRLLDVGGDKPLPYVKFRREENPFLGLRGIRLLFKERSLLETQVRAVLRAAVHGNIWIMAPMISTISEIVEFRKVVEEEASRLESRGIPVGRPRIGVMVEVPSIALQADAAAEHVDFFSIGTNDLTQYTLAADRVNADVAHIYDHAHPSVLRLVKMVVDAAEAKNRIVGVCGEAGSDPDVAPILLGLGVRRLSVAPNQIPFVRYFVSRMKMSEASSIANKALSAVSPVEVRNYGRRIIGENAVFESNGLIF